MKVIFEKIISISNSLNPEKQKLLISLLEQLSNKISLILEKNDNYKKQITGIKENTYDDNLLKAIDLLKLLGFSEYDFIGFAPEFLNWLISNTLSNPNYNGKLMNFYLLNTMQQAYMICYAENQGKTPTYNQVKKTMLGFDETIQKYESELKLSLPQLIKKVNGEN